MCLPEVDGVASVRRDLAAHDIAAAPLTAWERFTFSEDLFRQSRRDTLRTIREQRFARLIIVLPTIEFGGALIDAAAQADVPTAVVYQLVPYRHTFEPIERQIYSWARRQKQVWLTVSQQNRDVLCESLGWHASAGDVVPNALLRPIVRVDQSKREQSRQALRRELGIPADAFIALTVARLHVQKAHDVLIKAAASLAGRHSRVHFVWAGTGEIGDQLKTQVEEHGLAERVHMLGHRTDVAGLLLPAADAFSRKRGFTVPVAKWIEKRARTLAPLVARAEGIAQICHPERVEALFHSFGSGGGKHEGAACWQLLFYALWHRIHVEDRPSRGDIMSVLEAR